MYYDKYENKSNLSQHEFMSQFVDALANSLSVYDSHKQDYEYYKALSWAGLETSENYEELENKTEIQNIIRNERFNENAKGSKCN